MISFCRRIFQEVIAFLYFARHCSSELIIIPRQLHTILLHSDKHLCKQIFHHIAHQKLMMNPSAKEFVPAHILKKRQEEADRLAEDFVKVSIDRVGVTEDNSNAQDQNSKNQSPDKGNNDGRLKAESKDNSTHGGDEGQYKNSESNNHERDNTSQRRHTSDGSEQTSPRNNNHQKLEEYYSDDKHLLNAGEDICEFNGEQFIVPGDDEFLQAPDAAGYDFGNDEDNEDEDVCNAFEEFLENLPNQ